MRIAKSYWFDSAHRLFRDDWTKQQNEDVFGKCYRTHGHTYQLTVEVTGPIDLGTGMILNYFDLDAVMKPIVTILDHRYLNEVFVELEDLTTAENMVGAIADMVAGELASRGWHHITPSEIKLQETPKTYARWIADEDL